MISRRSRSLRSGLAGLVLVAFVATGCAGMDQRFMAGPDASDPCRAQRAVLDQSNDYFVQNLVGRAMVGAALGSLAGALKGRSPGRTAVAGAATGVVTGVASGYWAKQRQQAKNDQQLYASILGDVRRDNEQIDRAQANFDQVVLCRRREADAIRADLAANRIDRAQAQARMAKVRERYEQDLAVARTISANLNERSANFQFANEQVNPQPYQAVRDAVLRAQNAAGAREVGRLTRGTVYSASRADDDWFKVTLPGGVEGFVETAALTPSRPAPAPAGKPAPGARPPQQTVTTADPQRQQIDQETSTNLAKRDHLNESIQAASGGASAFELTS